MRVIGKTLGFIPITHAVWSGFLMWCGENSYLGYKSGESIDTQPMVISMATFFNFMNKSFQKN